MPGGGLRSVQKPCNAGIGRIPPASWELDNDIEHVAPKCLHFLRFGIEQMRCVLIRLAVLLESARCKPQNHIASGCSCNCEFELV